MDNKLKFGVSYNVFDGFELLEDSIIQIRDVIDYISVVYQKKSNWGNDAHPLQEEILNTLLSNGLIDELYLYDAPTNKENPKLNEIEKRNIGLELSKEHGCTHHMTMDCDEFYLKAEMLELIKWCNNNPDKTTYGFYIDYIKTPSIRIGNSLSQTMISLFIPILNDVVYSWNYKIPIIVDPSRITNTTDYEIIPSEMITMHHMTMIRKNIKTKIMNAGKRRHMTDEQLTESVKRYNDLDITSMDSIASYVPKLTITQPLFLLNNYIKIIL